MVAKAGLFCGFWVGTTVWQTVFWKDARLEKLDRAWNVAVTLSSTTLHSISLLILANPKCLSRPDPLIIYNSNPQVSNQSQQAHQNSQGSALMSSQSTHERENNSGASLPTSIKMSRYETHNPFPSVPTKSFQFFIWQRSSTTWASKSWTNSPNHRDCDVARCRWWIWISSGRGDTCILQTMGNYTRLGVSGEQMTDRVNRLEERIVRLEDKLRRVRHPDSSDSVSGSE